MSSQPPATHASNTVTHGSYYYTNLHLSAVASLYPPSPRNPKRMCETELLQEVTKEQNKLIRVYYTEPSYLGYNPGSYLIKETRYGVQQEWHAASDELVADDAAPGSPVAVVGWWVTTEDGQDVGDTWETRVYYVDEKKNIRERINHTSFEPTAGDDFDAELHKPEELIPPTPGWTLTPLSPGAKSDEATFPSISPLPTTKLAGVRSENGSIYVFYQGLNTSVHALLFKPGVGWQRQDNEIVNSQLVKPGTPLSAIVGGWNEIRLFYVTPEDQLAEVFKDDHTPWTKTKMPSYKLGNPTAMISAMAWNYASPFFQVRIYVAGEKDDLQEYSFSRNADGVQREDDGWIKADKISSGATLKKTLELDAPLSAVATVMLENGCNPKVYFHPRRAIAEWDACARTTFPAGLAKVGEKSEARRKTEKETRAKIQEEARKEEEKRKQEEKRRQDEKERKRKEEERKHEEEKRGPTLSVEDTKQKQEIAKITKIGEKMPKLSETLATKARERSGCRNGYNWLKVEDGWKCAGGDHTLTDAQFAAL